MEPRDAYIPGPRVGPESVPDHPVMTADLSPVTPSRGFDTTRFMGLPSVANGVLDADKRFGELRQKDSFGAMRSLFERDDLPGFDAKDRMGFVLEYTRNGPKWMNPSPHFRPINNAVAFNDTGFKEELRDGKLWPSSSNQVGHFLTAVDMGTHAGDWVRGPVSKFEAVGHEVTGDAESSTVLGTVGNWIYQGIRGVPNTWGFGDAVRAAQSGDYAGVDAFARKVIPSNPSPTETGRTGNSQQDVRLTVYGWALGDMIRSGAIKSREDVVRWLDQNIGAGK